MKTSITEQYILVETDDIDFSMLRLAVEEIILELEKLDIEYLEEL